MNRDSVPTTTPDTAPAPLSAGREREIRALLDRRNYSMGLAARYAIEDLLAAVNDLARERDEARKAGEWTDAMIDAACAVWDRHWATWDDALREEAREKIRDGVRAAMRVASSQPTPAQVERAAEALRKADPDWFASPDFRRSVAHTVLTAVLGGDHE